MVRATAICSTIFIKRTAAIQSTVPTTATQQTSQEIYGSQVRHDHSPNDSQASSEP